MQAHLPPSVQRLRLAAFFTKNAYIQPQVRPDAGLHLLQQARAFYAMHSAVHTMEHVQELSLKDVPEYREKAGDSGLVVMNWTRQSTVSVKLSPPEDEVRFRSDRTYWLAGLTGDLGVSLARWMVQRGARYVVMTSRNPNVDEKWLATMQAIGAIIIILPM